MLLTSGKVAVESEQMNDFHLYNLNINIRSPSGKLLPAVKNCSLTIPSGKSLGLVGESGSGKSLTALAIMKLLPQEMEWSCSSMGLANLNLKEVPQKDYHTHRGKTVSMIFQEPMTSLNPLITVGKQIAEVFQIHGGLSLKDAINLSQEMLSLVGIPDPEDRAHAYPHQLSGGMRQRIMIAMALACAPQLLIADEPTTALDVTIQAQILSLINTLQSKNQMSCLIITHDLGVVAESCDYIAVMYAGEIVETGPVQSVLEAPKHPYTSGLLQSMPTFENKEKKLNCIPGNVPPLESRTSGCSFHERCHIANDMCKTKIPYLTEHENNQKVACFFPLNRSGILDE